MSMASFLLQASSHVQILAHRPERTRKLVKAMLPEPLKVLSLDPEGHLLIPTPDEISKSCPVTLSGDQVDEFAAWRLEFLAQSQLRTIRRKIRNRRELISQPLAELLPNRQTQNPSSAQAPQQGAFRI